MNRSFSTPINLQFSQSAEDLALVARYEADHFARWQALIDLGLPNLLQAARDARQGIPVTCDAAFVDALLAAASDESLEPAFRAQALALPSEADIARELGGDNDPDAIHAGRQAILSLIAGCRKRRLRRPLREHADARPFSPDAASAGRRALRNAALYLSVTVRQCARPRQRRPSMPPTT